VADLGEGPGEKAGRASKSKPEPPLPPPSPATVYSPLDGMLLHRRATPGGTHIYTWVEIGTVRGVSCLRTQHNSPGQGPVSRKPRKLFGPAKPFLPVNRYLKKERRIRLKLLV